MLCFVFLLIRLTRNEEPWLSARLFVFFLFFFDDY